MAPLELGAIEISGQTLLGALSIVLSGGFVTTVIAVWKAKPERDSVVVLPWQNLTNTLGEHIRQLQSDWQREREARVQSDAARVAAEKQVDTLQDEIDGLERSVRKLKRESDALRRMLDNR